MDVYVNGKWQVTLEPERRFYNASRQNTSEVSIRRSVREDLYLNFAGMSQDGEKAVIQAYVFPLVSWIWAGAWLLFFGTFVCLVPSKVDRQIARTKLLPAELVETEPEFEAIPAQTGD